MLFPCWLARSDGTLHGILIICFYFMCVCVCVCMNLYKQTLVALKASLLFTHLNIYMYGSLMSEFYRSCISNPICLLTKDASAKSHP